MTPTPEPGQPVWIAAEVVASVAGHPMLTPITADGEPSAIRLAAARYRWHPADVPPQPESPANPRRLYWALRGLVEAVEKNAASLDHDAVRSALEAISAEDERYAQWSPDVPPQPPVLAEGMPVRIADDPSPWEIHTIAVKEELGWWSATVRLKPDLSGIRARRSAPLADVPGPDDTTPAAKLLEEIFTGGSDEPPVGEGAALIAATAQEIAAIDEPRGSRVLYAAQRNAWEATARRLAALLDVRGAPVQATTHREAGEAQERVQGDYLRHAAFVDNEGKPIGAPRIDVTAKVYPVPSLKPAVQGAGRDWRGEFLAVANAHQVDWRNTCRCGWTAPPGTDSERDDAADIHLADAIVAALGLHDLEQAAAEATRLRRVNDEWGLTMSTLIDGLAERGVPVKLGHRYTQAALDALDSARRELEQLRGDVSAIAHDCAARAAIPAGKAIPPDLWYTADRAQIAERLRAALAATAPATQDGADDGR